MVPIFMYKVHIKTDALKLAIFVRLEWMKVCSIEWVGKVSLREKKKREIVNEIK